MSRQSLARRRRGIGHATKPCNGKMGSWSGRSVLFFGGKILLHVV